MSSEIIQIVVLKLGPLGCMLHRLIDQTKFIPHCEWALT
jgi:hypothetical protein